ncbi:MAG: BspA family leucine-rich repeat surface protein [Bacilli bacterium]|nr:BspA family leucine-rich repeat surface protein [Bacilli bacterium]
MHRDNKGFTLVEILAVIVILAIIMLLAIPAVLDALEVSNQKSFAQYVERITKISEEKLISDSMISKATDDGCYIYNIETDLGLDNTGSFKGYVLLNATGEDLKLYYSLWNDKYMLIAYNYTDETTFDGKKKKPIDALEVYDASRSSELSPTNLCNYACSLCTYDNASNDPYNDSVDKEIKGDMSKVYGATKLKDGKTLNKLFDTIAGGRENIYYIKRSSVLDEEADKKIITVDNEPSKSNPVYVWCKEDTLYFYSYAIKIFLNNDSKRLFNGLYNVLDFSEFIDATSAIRVNDASYLFSDNGKIESIDLSNWELKNVTNMESMFYDDKSLKTLNLANINTSQVTSFHSMFNSCKSLEHIDGTYIDTSNSKNLSYMFANCENLNNLNVSYWNVSKVEDFNAMFYGCKSLEYLDVSKWDTSNGKIFNSSYSGMFGDCIKLKELDVSNWNMSKAELLNGMFKNCQSLSKLDVSRWNTSNVTNMNAMFYATYSLKELDISNWDVSKVTVMAYMFTKTSVRQLDFSKWKTDSLERMTMMFYYAKVTNLDLSSFKVDKVTELAQVFYGVAAKTIDISTWNTAQVTKMYRMFGDSTNLEHIYVGTGWSVEGLVYVSGQENDSLMFHRCSKLPYYDGIVRDHTKAYVGEGGYLEYKP